MYSVQPQPHVLARPVSLKGILQWNCSQELLSTIAMPALVPGSGNRL